MEGSEHTKRERRVSAGAEENATAVQTLRSEEAVRASGFGRTVVVLCIGAMAFVPFLPGVRWVRLMMLCSIGMCASVAAWVWIQAARPGRYDLRMFRIFGIAGVLSVTVGIYYSGVFSTGAVLVMLGILFFAQGDDGRWAVGLTATAVGLYILLSVGITVGIIPDLGIFRGIGLTQTTRIFAIVMVPYIFVITIWQARLSRKATQDAVKRLGAALRALQEREALLQEANQNFDAMLAAAGGHGGYSGRHAGDFVLGDVIGRGAMGEVYAATNAATGVRAAVKLLNPSALADPDLFQRFMREADILRRLTAPNVIALYDVGQLGGAPYIAMELLDGHDLAWSLRHRQKLPLAEVVELAAQVASGLDQAHRAGIVHRDLKPQNLFQTGASSTWKILDFGVAKLLGSDGTLTRGAMIGTPGYMSPEQARGADADHRADIFSLGAVIYRVLTGRPPFSGADVPEAIFQVVFAMPDRPSEVVPGLPRAVDDVLAVALAKRPEDRFATARELADAFCAAAEGRVVSDVHARASALVASLPWGHRPGEAAAAGTAAAKPVLTPREVPTSLLRSG